VDEDADAAVEARIWIGWNKFRQLVPLLTSKDIDYERDTVQQLCAKAMLHGNETWPVRKQNEVAFQWTEMRTIR